MTNWKTKWRRCHNKNCGNKYKSRTDEKRDYCEKCQPSLFEEFNLTHGKK